MFCLTNLEGRSPRPECRKHCFFLRCCVPERSVGDFFPLVVEGCLLVSSHGLLTMHVSVPDFPILE